MGTPAGGDADLAAVGALLGDPRRCRMLLALGDGRALPAGRLAEEAGVGAATASEHLSRLVAGGLLRVEPHGRYRYFRLAGPEVGALLEQMMRIAPGTMVRSMREGTRAEQLRAARSCYDHLAGRLGVDLMASFVDREWLVAADSGRGLDGPVGRGSDVDYRLSDAGAGALAELGVTGAAAPVRYCVDWTEQRHHLAGALGRDLLARVTALGWVRRAPGSRAVLATESGRRELRRAFGVDAR